MILAVGLQPIRTLPPAFRQGQRNNMTEETDSTSTEADQAETDRDWLTRRNVLMGTAAAGAIGVAGAVAMSNSSDEPVPEEHDWSPADAPLETRWFDEVTAEDPHDAYPRPQLVRDRWHSLNGVWGFEPVTDDASPPFGRTLDEGILVPFPAESALSGVGRDEDHVFYRRTFELPERWAIGDGERLLLHFEAVDYETTVSVNGTEVGSHTGGYDHFSFDITDALTSGGHQELVVSVVDRTEEGQTLGKQHPNEGGIWYTTTTGIWQTVWLEPVAEARVTSLDLRPDVEGERLGITVETTGSDHLSVEATVLADGTTVATASGAPGAPLEIPIPDPHLWSPDDPFLYDLSIEVSADSTIVDTVESYFGMRSVGTETIRGRPHLTLNGEPTFQLATLDQGFWPDGIYTAPTDEALAFDLERHAELGFNTVRKHVKIEPRRWYYHADRLGLLVQQDMPSTADDDEETITAQRDQFEAELRAMVDQLGNHPSITTWIPFNEGWGAYDQARLVGLIEEWDPGRIITANSGADVGGGDCGCGDVLDHHNYPGPGPIPHPIDRLAVLGEFGGMGLTVEDHRWDDGSTYAYDTYFTGEELTAAYVEQLDRVRQFTDQCGLSSAVYTQITDVENENNGIMTYDREVLKLDADVIRTANEAVIEAGESVAAHAPEPEESGGLDGLGYWLFDAGDGRTAVDGVGENDGRLIDEVAWTDGRDGSGLSFDGGYVDLGTGLLDTTASYSVAAWVRLAGRETLQTAVSQHGKRADGFALQFVGPEDRFAFVAHDSDERGTDTRAAGEPNPALGRWYHLVGVRSVAERAIRLFVNGELADEQPFCPGFDATGKTVVGSGLLSGTIVTDWDGTIDEVRLYDRALDGDEVSRLATR